MKYEQQVFDRLSKGGFISSDSVDDTTRRIFLDIDDCRDEYANYFSRIGFILEGGNQYYYFSRKESRSAMAEKLKKFGHRVDVLDFLKAWEPSFGPGFTFMTADLIVKIDSDIELRDKAALMSALPRFNEALTDIDTAKRILTGDDSRAAQAGLSGNSKIVSKRSCPGFLVNSFDPIRCKLDGVPFPVNPPEGSAVYIADWKSFVPPATALIVGVENMENFLMIRRQRELIESFLTDGETGILFAARYALSSDLADWLRMIPNRYLHFGDFDLAGIDIFLTQIRPAVGDRGSFLIPSDIETRISHGSRCRYDQQYSRYANLTTTDPDLTRLIGIIHRYRRTFDQEGYIEH